MKYLIRHTTSYHYKEPVSLCHNIVHLTPRTNIRQKNLFENIMIFPQPDSLDCQVDYFGNTVYFFTIQKAHNELVIDARYETIVNPREPINFVDLPCELVLKNIATSTDTETIEATEYTFDSFYITRHNDWLEYAIVSFSKERPFLESVMNLTTRIFNDFKYQSNATTIATPMVEVFKQKSGVCQDFSHFQIACLRSLGFPARYVSGYLLTNVDKNQEKLIGADASHAWLQVYYPGQGWFDFDPTNNLQPSDQHIFVAYGRDYDDVSPIRGVILGGEHHTIKVGVSIIPSDSLVT